MPVDDAFALRVPDKVVVVGVMADGEVRSGDRLLLRTATAEWPVIVESLEAYHQPIRVARRGVSGGRRRPAWSATW